MEENVADGGKVAMLVEVGELAEDPGLEGVKPF